MQHDMSSHRLASLYEARFGALPPDGVISVEDLIHALQEDEPLTEPSGDEQAVGAISGKGGRS